MCGIIGYIGSERVVPILMEGLSRLEYRGYDSAGIATLQDGELFRLRQVGKVRDLACALQDDDSDATIGIGHTRWATHGAPTRENAHPHLDCSGDIALIHNGIIENYLVLRDELLEAGHTFRSQTDTEVLAHLIEHYFDGDLLAAVTAAVRRAEGAFALAVLCSRTPDRLVAARRGSPLVVGHSSTGHFIASDIPALLGKANSVVFLADDELAELTRDTVRFIDCDGVELHPPSHRVSADQVSIQKGGYRHFMLKEIHEQDRSIGETVREKMCHEGEDVTQSPFFSVCKRIAPFNHIYLIACGTAYHASLTAEYMWERILNMPIQSMIASEFRMRAAHLSEKSLVIAVSQSGETIDTLMALRRAKSAGAQVIALVNNEQSTIDREADVSVYTHAGIEIGVAATKTFTAQIAALGLLGLHLGLDHLSQADIQAEFGRLALLPGRINESLQKEDDIRTIAEGLHHARDVLFLARGELYPIALEGALKLKEISYIHAEGYPAGEMKHGPIALIDEKTPVVFLLSRGIAFEKVLSNMEEVRARNGQIIAVTDAPDDPAVKRLANAIIPVPNVEGISRPILFTIPLQLLAYHAAVWRGTDVDQPRNL
ncbi:glutamine--fructose-6-phosphate transaminase (isomerizing), partial [Candidatus Bipolaricaulota bacterium]|nr:glutamine--fructose-6-phosphate transaminase (isomerizing) [Candidatus Bipolaricaulota bacterium]